MRAFETTRKAVALLTPAERRSGALVVAIGILAAITSAGMVGSVLPFLTVLSDPDSISEIGALNRAYTVLGYTSARDFLVGLGVFSVLAIVFSSAVQMLKTFAVARFTSALVQSLSCRLLERYLGQPYEFFIDRHSGELSATLLDEASELVRQFFRPAEEFVSALLTTFAVIAVLAWIDARTAFLAVALIGGAYGASFAVVRRQIRRIGKERAAANRIRYQAASEALQGIKDVKVLGRERAFLDRFNAPSNTIRQATTRVRVLSEMPRHVIHAAVFTAIVALCLALIPQGELRTGTALAEILPILGVFALGGQRLMPELQRLYAALTSLQYAAAAVDRVSADLSDLPAPEPEPDSPTERLPLKHSLELENVTYRYARSKDAGVFGITARIQRAERIGIVGVSGAGKTTLADIVLGLLTPTSGAMRADGVTIDAGNRRAWQKSVGYVPQDIFLAQGSVAENIAFGLAAQDIDRSLVRDCAIAAQLHDFVSTALPNGYDTDIGERGIRLSGGQRQRIGIARALYRDADLIVFDEATSALDSLTEAEVMQALQALEGRKTILIIAHRLSTLDLCDRILVLRDGLAVGMGTHAELLATCAPFRELATGTAALA